MSTTRHPIRFLLLIGILATSATACVIIRTEPAPSGITNKQVDELTLKELNTLLHDIATERAHERHTGGDVILVIFDHSYLLTQSQWETVAVRVIDELLNTNDQEFSAAARSAHHIEQYLHGNQHLAAPFRFQEIIDAAITRLHDPDLIVARRAGFIAGNFPSMLPAKVDIQHLLKLAESAPTPAHKEIVMHCISSIRFSHTQSPSVDAQIVATARATLDDPAATHKQRMAALTSISFVSGAAREAAVLAAEQYLTPPNGDQRMALLVLTRLVSIYDNPNAESRKIATEIAIPIFIQAAQSDDWSLQMSAAGAARHLYAQAEPLVPALLDMLDHPDFNVSGMAISALGNIGPAAADALPKLRSIKGTRGDLNESITDALYLIAKEGNKPDWYDRYFQQLKDTGVEIE